MLPYCMAAISRRELKEQIEKEKVIMGYEDLEKQLTSNGIDIRVCAIIEIEKAGEIGIVKKEHKKPRFGKVWVMKGMKDYVEGIDADEVIEVKKGEKISLKSMKPYLVVSCEEVKCPKNWFFKIEIKSSLFRLAQIILETAFGEADYKGKLTFLLLPTLDTALAIGASIAQIAFYELTSEASYEEQYSTSYQGGKIV